MDMSILYKYIGLIWAYVDSFFYLVAGMSISFFVVTILLDIFVFKKWHVDDRREDEDYY